MPRTRLAALCTQGVLAGFLALQPGCNSDSDSSINPRLTITVSGKVLGGDKSPVANSPVIITGRPATVTDANGTFAVTGVAVPYDVTVATGATKAGITYRSLSRSDPTITNFAIGASPAHFATITGTASGGAGFPQLSTRSSRVTVTSTEVSTSSAPNATTGSYSMSVRWSGSPAITASIHALQWEKNAEGMPVSYTGYAVKPGVPISSGGTFANQDITMTAVSSQTIFGSVSVPAGLVLSSKSMLISFAGNGLMTLWTETAATTAFSYPVPSITGATITLAAQALGSAGFGYVAKSGIPPGASSINLPIPLPPVQSLPVDAATGVSSATVFSWTSLASTVYLLTLTGPAGQPTYYVVTGTTTATIPDLSALGLGLPAGVAYSWNVLALGPHANIDAAAGPNGYYRVGDQFYGQTSSRTLTTAP